MSDDQQLVQKLEKELKRLKRRPDKETELSYQGKISTLLEENRKLKSDLRRAVKKHGIFRAIAEELEDIVVPLEPLPRQRRRPRKSTVEEHLVMHLSDEHADEIVEPHQVGGLEEYNFQVALCRAERYIDTLIKWTQTTLANHHFPVLHILSYGDHTSGEIHGASSRSEYRNMFRNSLAIGQMQALMIRDLAPYFNKIKVYCVPGNHGRRSKKKDFHGAWDNFDYLISEIARLHCADLKNVEFAIPDCYSISIDINGWGFGVEHGDGVRSWMSIPYYGLERKTRRLTALHHATDHKINYFVFGHFHAQSSMSDLRGETIINGAWPATNPYAYESFSSFREPVQLIHGVHKKYGISWRLYAKLRDRKKEKRGPQRYKIDLAEESFND